MKHPYTLLRPEYENLLAQMVVIRILSVNQTAARLLQYYREGKYGTVPARTGIPVVWIATSFERESGSNFSRSPAQGDRWDRVSVNVPRGRGPFPNWESSALDAYHLDGLDAVGTDNWSWPLACFYGELFNGFGYRDYHAMRSPYLWGGTNLQQPGKYIADGKFDSNTMDTQLGIVPIMARMVELYPALALPGAWPFPVVAPPLVAELSMKPIPSGVGRVGEHDTFWLQRSLNALGAELVVDGSYGRRTKAAVTEFQAGHGLDVDGLAGPKTFAALEAALTPIA